MGPNLSIKAYPAIAEIAALFQQVNPECARRYAALAQAIKTAPKFLLPSIQAGERRGNLLNWRSDWSGFEDTVVPPYPVFCIEYQVFASRDHEQSSTLDVAPDRIIVCWVQDTDPPRPQTAVMRVASVYAHSTYKQWQVCPLVAMVEIGRHRQMNYLRFADGRMGTTAVLMNEFLPEDGVRVLPPAVRESVPHEIGEELLHAYEMLIVMNTNNATLRKEDPPIKLNKKRIAKGKEPFQTYHVLDVPHRSDKGPAQGGTHASPRFHLRRGHIRRLPTGRTTWVRPSAVGDPSRGSVRADYRVRSEVA